MNFSFSWLFTIVFLAFIGHSLWSLAGIFRIPVCAEGEICYSSYLNSNPNLDLIVYISDSSRSGNYESILTVNKFNYRNSFEQDIMLELTKSTRNNGSLNIHVVLVPSSARKSFLTITELANIPDSTYLRNSLTQYAIPLSASFNLLKEDSKTNKFQEVTHLKRKFAVAMCTDEFGVSSSTVPFEIHKSIRVNRDRQFLPILKPDTMQMRLRDLEEIAPNTKNISFTFVYSPVGVGKMRFLTQIDAALLQFIALGFTEKDLDEVKGIFADTNFYLLCATIVIGSIHLLLDFLSFKNDVNFWNNQKSLAGLSSTAVFWRAFSQSVIFFYLLEEGTSLLVLIPSGVATIIEFWKVSKILKRTLEWKGGIRFGFVNNSNESAEELQTRKYDEECMKYLSYVLYPLCIGAAIYSLLYQPHKSWYSWTIGSMVNGVYAFGFLFMLPQLFINYRLKSVAALPWRAFTYRAFNTFIDDIFAFIITMPIAHRVACFRDDLVFIVYLYQRWLYPVDKTRMDTSTSLIADNDVVDKKTK